MKRFLGIALLALFAVVLCQPSGAQTVTANQHMPKIFASMDDCVTALQSGNVAFYMPSAWGDHNRNPVDGVNRITRPLPENACVHMRIFGDKPDDKHYVAQQKGTIERWERESAADPWKVYARDDCGNAEDELVLVSAAPAAQVAGVSSPPPASGANVNTNTNTIIVYGGGGTSPAPAAASGENYGPYQYTQQPLVAAVPAKQGGCHAGCKTAIGAGIIGTGLALWFGLHHGATPPPPGNVNTGSGYAKRGLALAY